MSQPSDKTEPIQSGANPTAAPNAIDETSSPAPNLEVANEEAAANNDSAAGESHTDTPTTDLEALKAQAAKASEHWDQYLRARAELDNYRRRATRERQEALRYASQSLVEKLLPVLDSLEKAAEASQTDDANALESLREGLALVQSQFQSAFTDAGIQPIDATGQPFDPNLHEAVAHHESAEVADGHVLQQIRKGYLLHDRLVRPATVVVAKPPASE